MSQQSKKHDEALFERCCNLKRSRSYKTRVFLLTNDTTPCSFTSSKMHIVLFGSVVHFKNSYFVLVWWQAVQFYRSCHCAKLKRADTKGVTIKVYLEVLWTELISVGAVTTKGQLLLQFLFNYCAEISSFSVLT